VAPKNPDAIARRIIAAGISHDGPERSGPFFCAVICIRSIAIAAQMNASVDRNFMATQS
jgi:hypothetical protein